MSVFVCVFSTNESVLVSLCVCWQECSNVVYAVFIKNFGSVGFDRINSRLDSQTSNLDPGMSEFVTFWHCSTGPFVKFLRIENLVFGMPRVHTIEVTDLPRILRKVCGQHRQIYVLYGWCFLV